MKAAALDVAAEHSGPDGLAVGVLSEGVLDGVGRLEQPEGDDRRLALGQELAATDQDTRGGSLSAPMPGKVIKVMIEAGAIFHMFRSYVSVGSTAPSIAADRSGGALQVLGTPNNRVYFTTNNESSGGIGLDENTSTAPKERGDWGGISFKNDLDRADGRFDHEAVGVFLNYVNHADIRYGGGQVNVDSDVQVVTPIAMTDARRRVGVDGQRDVRPGVGRDGPGDHGQEARGRHRDAARG